jgi:iron(III) transport system substrate-binding protein
MSPLRSPESGEARVVVYSAAFRPFCTPLLEGFAAQHPDIEVEFIDGISSGLHQRYLDAIAAGRPAVDVLWSSAMDLQMGLVQAGHAQVFDSPNAAALPAWANYRNMAFATTLEPLVTLVNRNQLGAAVTAGSLAEITELANGKPDGLRGKIACYDITSNGLGFLALLHDSGREAEFEAFMQLLGAAQPRTFGSNPPLVDEVASGRAALAYHVLGAFALRALRANASLAVAASAAPRLAVSRIAFIPASAPHPAAARKFLDYMLSESGQRRLGEAELFPLRTPVAAPELGAAALKPMPIVDGFGEFLDPARRARLLARWQQAVGAATVAN